MKPVLTAVALVAALAGSAAAAPADDMAAAERRLEAAAEALADSRADMAPRTAEIHAAVRDMRLAAAAMRAEGLQLAAHARHAGPSRAEIAEIRAAAREAARAAGRGHGLTYDQRRAIRDMVESEVAEARALAAAAAAR
ncbi:MAG TPA: hypothetical protein VGB49_05980 [Caulobacteraceae bacterium]